VSSTLERLAARALVGAVAGVLLPLSIASAAPIDGTVELSGAFVPVDGSNIATSLDLATGIDFTTDGVVVGSSGDLISLTFGTLATMTDFQFAPLNPNPVTVWSAGGFSFSMDSITVVDQNATSLELEGSGVLQGGGLDDTAGVWRLTGQTTTGVTFSWSSSNASAVPVPAALWLFGSGLLGMAGIVRRQQSA
jgi:hypothetical protein